MFISPEYGDGGDFDRGIALWTQKNTLSGLAGCLNLFYLGWHDIHKGVVVGLSVKFLLSLVRVGDQAFCDSKNSEVSSHLNTFSGKPLGSFLSNDDIARYSSLASEEFDASALGL